MTNRHGDFIWYELMTTDADAARDFYGAVVGWDIEGQASGPADYRMISSATGPVAGLLPLTAAMTAEGARPGWFGYVNVDDVDAMAESIESGGGKVMVPAHDMPGIGRFAMVTDPEGVPIYVMKPTPPADQPDATSLSFSYGEPRVGHCAWNELYVADPAAALHFYGMRFGWVKDGEMDMGPMGKYEFLRHGEMIGAVMPKPPQAPVPAWNYYFRVDDIDRAAASIGAHGGTVVHGPVEVPGGDWSMNAIDPQGAAFALVGKKGSGQ